MKPEHRLALQTVCRTQEDLQKVWNNPAVYRFNNKLQAWVTMCVAEDGGKLVWTACVRLANPKKRNFKSRKLWTISETLKARSILINELDGVGSSLGEEEFSSTKGLHLARKLTAEERDIVLRPELLGN